MELKSLAIMASVLMLAAPAFAATDTNTPSDVDIRNREIHDQHLQKLATQKIMASVQSRLPQAEIANLLTQIEDATRGTGPIAAAEAGRIEDELARQKQFWQEEYKLSLGKGSNVDLETFTEGADLGKGFDDLVNTAMTNDPSAIAPEDLRVIYQEYDSLSQTFQQLKLARFLSGCKDGVVCYNRPKVDRAETAAVAAEMDAKFLPGYQKRLQEGVSNLRKILVAAK